jgi:hypothetical protein
VWPACLSEQIIASHAHATGVTRLALQKASSIASLVLSIDCIDPEM